MNQFHRATNLIKARLESNPYVKTVLFGVSQEKDLYKKSIYPIAHIVPVSAPMGTIKMRTNAVNMFAFEVAVLDQRDISKSIATEKFDGNDNLQDNLNITYFILNDLISWLKQVPNDMNIELSEVNDFSPVLFKDFNLLDGWVCRFVLMVPVIDPTDTNPSGSGGNLFDCDTNILTTKVVNYIETSDIIFNPERGVHKYTKNITDGEYDLLDESFLNEYKNSIDKVSVIFRYVLLEDYFNTDVIDNTYLDNLQSDFDAIRNSGMKVIIRIAYNIDNKVNTQPSKSRIISHIEALAPTFNQNKDVILSYQAGSIGKYGEWYYTDNSSEFGDEGNINQSQWLNRKDVVDAMLTNFEDLPIQVRYASAKRSMYGNEQINNNTAYQNNAISRIGFYNDAFLNSYGDMGTYDIDNECDNPVGSLDFNYIKNASQYLPLTGETNGMNDCDGGLRTSGANALYELDLLNFTLLNRDYNLDVWDEWVTSGEYVDIVNKLGYRLVLTSSILTGNKLSLNINNKGFSKLLFEKKLYLILRKDNTDIKVQITFDVRTLPKGNNTININIPNNLDPGEYELLLQIADKNLDNRPEYSIRFANSGTWETETGYNILNQTIKL